MRPIFSEARQTVPVYKEKHILNSVIEFLEIIHYAFFNLKTTFLRLDSVIILM